MVGDHPRNGISTGDNFMSYVFVPNLKSVVHFLLVNLGWWVTILEKVGYQPGDGG